MDMMGYQFLCFYASYAISKPFSTIFRNSLKAGYFLRALKKANVVPVHKKGNKQILSNYRPVSFLPICGKLFEKIIFDTIFQHLKANKLLNPNQSAFMLAILVYISSFQLSMKYMPLLMLIPH